MNRSLKISRRTVLFTLLLYTGTTATAQSECPGSSTYSPNARYKNVTACKPVPSSQEVYGEYGWQYECVEYVRRFYGVALQQAGAKGARKSSWIGDAKTFLDAVKNAKRGLVAFKNNETTSPKTDDILVFYGGPKSPGHVAIITNVTLNSDGSGQIDFIEQNFSSKTAFGSLKLTVNSGTNGITYTIANRGDYTVAGWARLQPQNTVFTNATFNGQPWAGAVEYNITTPQGTITNNAVPGTSSNQPAGNYTVNFIRGGPPNSYLAGISPSTSQTLVADGNLDFTLRFSTIGRALNSTPVFNAEDGIFLSRPILDSKGILRLLAASGSILKVYAVAPNGNPNATPTGKKNWETISFPVDVRGTKQLMLAPNDRVYSNGASTTVHAFDDLGNLVQGWPRTIGSAFTNPVFFSPLVLDSQSGTLYAKANDSSSPFTSTVTGLNSDGSEKWHRDFMADASTGTTLIQGPSSDLYSFIYPNNANVQLVRFDRNTGVTVCSKQLTSGAGSNRASGDEQGMFTDNLLGLVALGGNCGEGVFYQASPNAIEFRGYDKGVIFAIDYPANSSDPNTVRLVAVSAGGSFLWRNGSILPNTAERFILAVRNGILYVTGQHLSDSNKQKIFLLSVNSGQIVNTLDASSVCLTCGIAVANDGSIYAVDSSVTKINKFN